MWSKFFFRKKAGYKAPKGQESFSFFAYAWKQFKQNKPAWWSYKLLRVLLVLALLAPLLANDKPLYCKYKGQHLFPAFSFNNSAELKDPVTGNTEVLNYEQTEWKTLELESVCWALLSVYAPGESDIENSDFVGPFHQQVFKKANGEMIVMPWRFKHWLGTTKTGSDVLSGLLHGIKFSLIIGICSMLIASVIGLILGALAGYFGNTRLKTTRGSFLVFIAGIFMAFYYGFFMRAYKLAEAFSQSAMDGLVQFIVSILLTVLVIYAFYCLGRLAGKVPGLSYGFNIPVDSFVSRGIEIMNSLPVFMLILTISAIARPSYVNLILIIGLTSWASIARLTRAEFLRISSLDYIQAGKALGLNESRIIFSHALPNGLAPVFIQIAFGIAGAILIESALSFLGVGVPPEVVTWGKLLNEGRENFAAWWMVIFPGLAIFIIVTIYNLIGEGLRDALDPRLKK